MTEQAVHPPGDGGATAEGATGGSAVAPVEPSAGEDKPAITRGRHIAVIALISVTTVLALVGMLSVWANRLLFSPDNWENASTQLLQNSEIRTATSNYLVQQLYANVNVAGVLKAGLPPRLQPLAGPAAGALQNVAVQGVELALSRPRVQTAWAKANRAADQAFIAIVNGGTRHVGVNQGVVTLNLGAIVADVAAQLGLPASITSKLPPNVANLRILRSNQLKLVQNGGNLIRHLALWLTILVPLLYGAAILLAQHYRRRTLMSVGFAIVVAGLLGVAARRLLVSQITDSLVQNTAARPAVRATVGIGTSILGDIAGAFILVGAVVVVAAWFAGPSGIATPLRRSISPFLRERPVAAYAAVTALMVLVFIWNPIPATGKPAGIIVFMALALLGTEVLRRQTALEFPDARPGDASAAIRARWRAMRGHAGGDGAVGPVPDGDLADQLEHLSALQRDGAITPDEYAAAKNRLLHA